jgi:hypothetical protein
MVCTKFQSSSLSLIPAESESLFATTLECGKCAKGFLWAIGIEVAAAACLYGIWQALRIIR